MSERLGLLYKIANEYCALQKVDSKHELLKYVTLRSLQEAPVIFNNDSWPAFLRRFGASLEGSMTNYATALREEAVKYSQKVEVAPK